MAAPAGFTWAARKNGELAISRDGRVVTVVRGRPAERLIERLTSIETDELEEQHLLARATGNYRRGNERP